MALASVVFIPFLKFRGVSKSLIAKLMIVGGFQLGLMYRSTTSLSYSFLFQKCCCSLYSPIYVTLIYDFLKGRFRLVFSHRADRSRGAAWIKFAGINENFLMGFWVVQGANLCFAIGQVGYKYIMESEPVDLPQHTVFGYFYLGALCVATVAFALMGNLDKLPTTATQWGIFDLPWFDCIRLWLLCVEQRATLVNAGALAVMNNALVPAGLIVNIVIWNRDVDIVRLAIGGAIIMLSLWINETWVKNALK